MASAGGADSAGGAENMVLRCHDLDQRRRLALRVGEAASGSSGHG